MKDMALSPILNLFENLIYAAPFRIAPEKEAGLIELLKKHKIQIQFVKQTSPFFHVSVGVDNVIKLRIATLEFLWASTHAQYILYTEYTAAQRLGQQDLRLSCSSRCINAFRLLIWAFDNMRLVRNSSWPIELPIPSLTLDPESDVHVTNELFLCALSWIIHHEIQHVILGHNVGYEYVSNYESIGMEMNADAEAVRWIISGAEKEKELVKRLLGVVTAIIAIQTTEVSATPPRLLTHPKTFERLYHCLEISEVDNNSMLYSFASAQLQLHLGMKRICVPPKIVAGDDFKGIFSELLVRIAQE